MISKKYKIIGIIFVLILIVIGGVKIILERNIYEYDVDVGVAGGYYVLLDRTHNYFTDQQGKKLLGFTSYGGSPMVAWGGGEQATALGITAPLP